jgi:hypothetical protein
MKMKMSVRNKCLQSAKCHDVEVWWRPDVESWSRASPSHLKTQAPRRQLNNCPYSCAYCTSHFCSYCLRVKAVHKILLLSLWEREAATIDACLPTSHHNHHLLF